ncbi:MAG: type IV pilin N-terminal domain-containing protein [Candidatus Thermoplasmatota archaeon]
MTRSTQRKSPERELGWEAAVSDVLGSILLVGITVVMAAGFGAVLLSYDGPVDQLHAQLAVTIGPGADGDWGASDAEITVQHIGGEPLDDDDTIIRYRGAAGTTQTVAHAFPGGDLAAGETWTGTISADAGEAIHVDVVVAHAGRDSLVSSGTASAGGATAFLTYVTSVTAVSGWGSVLNEAFAGVANDGQDASLQEGSVGGTPTTVSPVASTGTVTNNGASGSAVKVDDDTRSALDAAGDWVQGNVFPNNPSGVVVNDIAIAFQGRSAPTCQAIAHQATFTGTASGGTTVTSAAITIAVGHTYVAAVATGNDLTAADVTAVSGPTGITWAQVAQVSNGAGTSRLEVWVGTGTASIVGVVTATFAGTIDRAGIAVSRYSNVDASAPVQASTTNTATGTAVTTSAIAGTATSGRFYMAVNGVGAGTSTPTDFNTPSDGGQRSDLDVSGEVQLDVADEAAAASNAGSADLSASNPWQAIGVTLRPTCSALTTGTLSYQINGVSTGSTQTFQLTASDAEYSLNVISDRAWVVGDLANLGVRVTLSTAIAGSTTEVDLISISLTTADAPTQYRSDFELQFNDVPAGASSEVVQLRYKTNGADSFYASVWTGSAWRACPGLLNSVTYTIFSCAVTLTPTSEHQATNPNIKLRLQDSTPAGTTRGTVLLDYARVATS